MLSPTAWEDLKRLPGNMRRRMIKAIDGLEEDARPSESKQLDLADEQQELRRLRLGHWRVVYLIVDERPLVLAIRRRPPYNYTDLTSLIEEIE